MHGRPRAQTLPPRAGARRDAGAAPTPAPHPPGRLTRARAQDAWAIAAEAQAKLGERADNPSAKLSSLLQEAEGGAAAGGAAAAGAAAGSRAAAEPADAADAGGGAFLQASATAGASPLSPTTPLSPTSVPQMAALVRRLELMLGEAASEVATLDPDKPTGVP